MEFKDTEHKKKRAPLWQWVLIILLVVAMPLFFSFVRTSQTQQVLNEESVETNAAATNNNQ